MPWLMKTIDYLIYLYEKNSLRVESSSYYMPGYKAVF